jgi:predicted P-loop ATPase
MNDIYKGAKKRAAQPQWLKECMTGSTGQPLPNVANVLIGLRADYRDAFAYDEMRCVTVFKKSRDPLIEADIVSLQEQFQLAGLKRVGSDTMFDGVMLHSRENSFHPLREYLADLEWDGKLRVGNWLTTYLGAEESEYTKAVGRMFLISMIARVMKPGCKVDHMPVFEGPQGALKSTACRVLAGEDYFTDNLPDLDSKDASQHLRGKWVVEIAELHSFDRATTNRLKSYLTRQEERYRPSYGRLDVDEPRQCVFVGTTNKDAYLRDETGGRRFWPIKVGTINIEALKRDRDQLFAEAHALFNAKAKWWPDQAFEREHIMPQQSDRYEADPWEEPIRNHLATVTKVTITEVAKAIGIDTPRISRAEQNRIMATMLELGWKRGRRGAQGVRWWVKE